MLHRPEVVRPPVPLTPLVGRTDLVACARDLLRRPDVRLVTLVGAGGIGKTRLALTVAAEPGPTDGAAWIPLASIVEPDAVLVAIAEAVGVVSSRRALLLDALKRALRDARLVLLLDTFEQVLGAATEVVDLLGACPGVKALVTSRFRLGASGEHVVVVPPLTLPADGSSPTPDELDRAEAVRLFVERARAADRSFALTTATGPRVAEVCRRLDGVPLAIELAAARIAHLDIDTLCARLEPRLPLLTGGPRDQPERHRTMRDAIAWSHDLLTPDEQTLFRRLSVFAGGCTLDAAEDVATAGTRDQAPGTSSESVTGAWSLAPGASVLDGLASLVDKSLVQLDTPGSDGPRYRTLATIHEYAAELLAASPEAAASRRAHATVFLAFAERHELERFVPFDRPRLDRLEAEHDNLLAALAWLARDGDDPSFVRLVAALGWSWWVRGRAAEAQAWLTAALDRVDAASPQTQSKLAIALGYNAIARGDEPSAARVLAEQLDRCRALDDRQGTAHMLLVLGALDYGRGEPDRATARLTEALDLARSLADPVVAALATADVLAELGVAAHTRGRLDDARAHHTDALRLHREAGFTYGALHSLADLGDVFRDLGDTAAAADHYRQALALARQFGQRRVVIWALEGLACAAAAGDPARAASFFGAAERAREASGISYRSPIDRAAHDRAMIAARAALGVAAFDRAWTAGRARPLDATVAAALDEATASPAAPLTPRERDVLCLLVEGRTDRAIAAALGIGERTVETHVARVLAKLGARTRGAAVAAALGDGLVAPPAGPAIEP